MAAPHHLELCTYNVGFGDCFLLTFHYSGHKRHLLIDFGSVAGPRHGQPAPLEKVARDIARRCDGKLHAIVATHRHRDHINGFAGKPGKIIAAMKPDVVVQPWTEHPGLAPKANAPLSGVANERHFVASMHNMHLVARHACRHAAAPGLSLHLARQLRFLGEDNLPNLEAVGNLMTMGRSHRYVYAGARDPLSGALPGVRTRVLGPPTLAQTNAIRRQRVRDEDEFWHLQSLAASVGRGSKGTDPFPRARTYRSGGIPPAVQLTLERLQRLNDKQLLSIVRALDTAINNTSVILLIAAGAKTLLFPGDAQIESWEYALPKYRKYLAGVDLYKVGHHGSLNATPKTLWSGFSKRGGERRADRLTTVLSTRVGLHGSHSDGTEVPRALLVDALRRDSTLVSTQSSRALCSVLEIDLGARRGHQQKE